jgi:hypothetical protein
MPRPPQAALLLEELGVSDHSHLAGRSRAEHLTATFEILADWGAPEEVTLAGLFHSVYGTDAFDHPSLPPDGLSRLRVRNAVGAAAERLAYMFCALEREIFLANPAGRRLAGILPQRLDLAIHSLGFQPPRFQM